MKFKNNTGEDKRVRLPARNGWQWTFVRAGEEIELSRSHGLNLGLTPLEDNKDSKPDPKAKADKAKQKAHEAKKQKGITVTEAEALKEAEKAYKKRLVSIKGVGDSTAADIMAAYPTVKDLVHALSKGVHISARDDVAAALEKEFKEATE